mgnify:CR=1 FL=1
MAVLIDDRCPPFQVVCPYMCQLSVPLLGGPLSSVLPSIDTLALPAPPVTVLPLGPILSDLQVALRTQRHVIIHVSLPP